MRLCRLNNIDDFERPKILVTTRNSMLLCVLCALALQICPIGAAQIDWPNTLVWGPGLDYPDFNLPVRYFFVQLVDKDGNNLTRSLQDDKLVMRVDGEGVDDKYGCRVSQEILHRRNGSYIIRYKLRSSCHYLTIHLTNSKGFHLAKSPYTLKRSKGAFNQDECDCPTYSINRWVSDMHCPSYPSISHSLSLWPKLSVNFSLALERAKERWAKHPGAHSFCHYRFISNRIYRHCYGEHVGFNMFSDAILLSLARKMRLPDTELLINLGDWPLETKSVEEGAVPLVSWCGSKDTRDITIPSYELTEATLEMMGRQSLDMQSVQTMTGPIWDQKLDKAVFRGRDSRQERLDLVLMAREHPEHLEAGITRFFFFRDQMDLYGPEVEHMPFGDFFKYRYQVNVDGTVAAYRLAYLLAGDSLVLKQDSPYFEHFYTDLQPWVHYVPLKRDLSDILTKIEWARENQNEVLEIIKNANEFVSQRLQPRDVFCYHAKMFNEYSKLLAPGTQAMADKLELVKQIDNSLPCLCHQSKIQRKEEL